MIDWDAPGFYGKPEQLCKFCGREIHWPSEGFCCDERADVDLPARKEFIFPWLGLEE